MTEFSLREFINNHRDSILDVLKSQRDLGFNDNTAAHARIFQMVISLTTLSLTAWVALVTWKFSAVDPQWWRAISSCVFLIFSALMIAMSDFCIILQSKYFGEIIEAQKKHD